MCLIFAVFGPHNHEGMRQYFRAGWKRGPNAQRYDRLQNGITLGFGRLTIQDAHTRSMQPLCLPKHADSILLYNGEVYRVSGSLTKYRRATELDGEYLLEGQLAGKMNEVHGKYAALVLDRDASGRMTLTVLRDKIGVRSLWYCVSADGTYVFASDPACMPWPDRMKEFPPGGKLTAEVDNESGALRHVNITVRVNTYWPSRVPAGASIIEMRKLFVSTLARAVLRRTRARDATSAGLGFLVSGGIDSGLVLALGAQDQAQTHAWTMSMSNAFGTPTGTDSFQAKILVDHLKKKGRKIMHYDVSMSAMKLVDYYRKMPKILNSYDETSCRASAMMLGVMMGVKKTELPPGSPEIKCIMSGEGADEAMLGYTDTLLGCAKFKGDPAELKRQLKAWQTARIGQLHSYDVRRAEMVIAHVGCEGRFPFLDEELLEVMLNLPIELLAPGAGMDDLKSDPKLAPYVFSISTLTKTFMRGAVFQEAPDLLPLDFLFNAKAAFSDATSDDSCSFHNIVKGFVDTAAPGVSELDYLKSQHPKTWAVTVPEPWRPWWVDAPDVSSARDWSGHAGFQRSFDTRLNGYVNDWKLSLGNSVHAVLHDIRLTRGTPKVYAMPETVPPLQFEAFSKVCGWVAKYAQFYYPGLKLPEGQALKLDTYAAPDNCNVLVWGSTLFGISLAVMMKDGKVTQVKYVFDQDAAAIVMNPTARVILRECLQRVVRG